MFSTQYFKVLGINIKLIPAKLKCDPGYSFLASTGVMDSLIWTVKLVAARYGPSPVTKIGNDANQRTTHKFITPSGVLFSYYEESENGRLTIGKLIFIRNLESRELQGLEDEFVETRKGMVRADTLEAILAEFNKTV